MIDFSKIVGKEIITITFTLFAVIDMLGSIPVLITLREKWADTSEVHRQQLHLEL